MSEEKKDYGKVTIGFGKADQQELSIVDFVQSLYIDNRYVGCSKLEDGTYCIVVENLQSSGRNPQNTMRLSEESLAGLIANCLLYFQIKHVDINEMMTRATKGGEIKYTVSDNLKHPLSNG